MTGPWQSVIEEIQEVVMFEQALLAAPRRGARGTSFALSVGAQMLVLGTALLIPLMLVEGPSVARLGSILMAPPLPPPPPPVEMKLVQTQSRAAPRLFDGVNLFAPRAIPKNVAIIDDPVALPDPGQMAPGVIGGIGGGVQDGVLSGILDQARQAIAPPKEQPKPVVREKPVEKAPTQIRVSSGVQEAKLTRRVIPVYPQLAKAARISGTVKLVGVIARDGRIDRLQVLSGHPLLVPAAVEAVRQWVYQPTMLSGEPVEVIAPIDVNFTLSQ
jgi:protein TonB